MNICIIIPSFYPAVVYGGWVFSSINTCRELSRNGIKCFVSTTNDNGKESLSANFKRYKEIEKNIFVKYYPQTIKEKFSISMFARIAADIKACDLVHIQGIFSLPSPLGLFFSNFYNKKILISPHGCLGEWCLKDGSKFKKIYLNYLIKPFIKKAIWHATSLQEKQEINALFPNSKVEIIPNGVYIDDFKETKKYSRTEFVKKYTNKDINADKIIISMSRLHKKKGLDILIKSFYRFLKVSPNAVLLMAGEDFGEKKNLEELIKDLNINDRVFFIGHIRGQDRVNFFANADLFVLPSHNENFGMVYAEAMAAGIPVIASKGTPWEEIEKLKIGKWIDNNPSATTAAMIDIFSRDFKMMGKKSQEFIEKNYSWEKIGKKFEVLFTQMLKDK